MIQGPAQEIGCFLAHLSASSLVQACPIICCCVQNGKPDVRATPARIVDLPPLGLSGAAPIRPSLTSPPASKAAGPSAPFGVSKQRASWPWLAWTKSLRASKILNTVAPLKSVSGVKNMLYSSKLDLAAPLNWLEEYKIYSPRRPRSENTPSPFHASRIESPRPIQSHTAPTLTLLPMRRL